MTNLKSEIMQKYERAIFKLNCDYGENKLVEEILNNGLYFLLNTLNKDVDNIMYNVCKKLENNYGTTPPCTNDILTNILMFSGDTEKKLFTDFVIYNKEIKQQDEKEFVLLFTRILKNYILMIIFSAKSHDFSMKGYNDYLESYILSFFNIDFLNKNKHKIEKLLKKELILYV